MNKRLNLIAATGLCALFTMSGCSAPKNYYDYEAYGQDTSTASTVPIVILSQVEAELDVGEPLQLLWKLSSGQDASLSVSFESSDTSVATVNDAGQITAVNAGTTQVKAFCKDSDIKEAYCNVTVRAIEACVLNPGATLHVGDTGQLNWILQHADYIQDPTVQINSTDHSVVIVDEYGKFQAVGEGTAQLIISSGSDIAVQEAAYDVTVLPFRKAKIANSAKAMAKAGEHYTVSVKFSDCSNPSVKIVAECAGTVKSSSGSVKFNSGEQLYVFGDVNIEYTVPDTQQASLFRLMCYDGGQLFDSKEISVMLSVDDGNE